MAIVESEASELSASHTKPDPRLWILLASVAALLAWWLAAGRDAPSEPASRAREVAAEDAQRTDTQTRSDPELSAPALADGEASLVTQPSAASVARRSATSDDGTLRVRIVDPLGAPRPGIAVWAESTLPMMPDELPGQVQISQADGLVEYGDLRRYIASAKWPWKLRADIVSERPCELALDAAALALDVVRFELPAGGELEIVVRELDGSPALDGSPVKLRLAKDPEQLLEASALERDARTSGGRVRFGWVELGREWEALAWRPKGSSAATARFARPSTLGERVEIELVLGAESAVVSYRVLTPDLEVFAGRRLIREQIGLFGNVERSEVVTDEHGRFTLDARASDLEPDSFALSWTSYHGEEHFSARAKRLPATTPGWIDGGDIVLEDQPVLCSGRVLERDGSPAAQATVTLGEAMGWGSAPRTITCDEEGRFEERGVWPQDALTLRASLDGRESQPQYVQPPARDLELVLTHTCTLSGQLLVDKGVDPSVVHFVRDNGDGTRTPIDREQRQLFAWGNRESDWQVFRLRPLAPGPLDLVLLLDDFELARLTGLQLTGDLDLGQIDLRGKLRVLEIELVAPEPDAKLEGDATWRLSDGGTPHQVNFDRSPLRIVSPVAPIDVDLRVRGYRRATFERLDANTRHVLQPPLRVRLALRTSDELPKPPLHFEAELYDGASTVSAPAGARYFTPTRNTLELAVGAPGSFRVLWRLERHFEGDGFGGATAAHVLEQHSIMIEVRDVPGVQEFVLELPPGALSSLEGALK
ncbi:MAG: carboxypeptidase regulatory-like domain-containing protein [Planctomycetes bacterium]|nr:carboxypeptidase regulatory-like domain-containing protein [Planctomycetota bacterium]